MVSIEERDAQIAELLKQGVSGSLISAQLNVSQGIVRRIREELGIAPRINGSMEARGVRNDDLHPTTDHQARIAKLYHAGVSYARIAEIIGSSRDNITKLIATMKQQARVRALESSAEIPKFRPIAWRPRMPPAGQECHQWTPFDDAPMTYQEARQLVHRNLLITCQRHEGDRVVLLAKSPSR